MVVGVAAILGILTILFLVTRFDDLRGGDQAAVQPDSAIFAFGDAEEFASTIARDGPLLFQDAASGDRDIWIQHQGDDASTGWSAFAVRTAGADRECFVEWNATDRTFVDICDGTTYPEDGDGLDQYSIGVDGDGNLTVDLSLLTEPAGSSQDESEE